MAEGSKLGRLVLIAVLAGAGWYGYKEGWFDGALDAFTDGPGGDEPGRPEHGGYDGPRRPGGSSGGRYEGEGPVSVASRKPPGTEHHGRGGYGNPTVEWARGRMTSMAPEPFDRSGFFGSPAPGESTSLYEAKKQFNRLYSNTQKLIERESRRAQPNERAIRRAIEETWRAKIACDRLKRSAR